MDNPRQLTEEVEEEVPQKTLDQLEGRIATLRSVRALFDTDGWKHLQETFAYERATALSNLIRDDSSDNARSMKLRGKLEVLDGFIGLPQNIPLELKDLESQRAKLAGGEDEDND